MAAGDRCPAVYPVSPGRRSPLVALVALLFVLLLAGLRVTSAAESLQDFDRRLDAGLRAQNPQAADLLAEANAAREKNDHARAAELYGRVFELAPQFVPALRRQCGEVFLLGKRR